MVPAEQQLMDTKTTMGSFIRSDHVLCLHKKTPKSFQKKQKKKKEKKTPYFYLSFFFFFFFLGPHPRHMEVPRLGVKSEL